MGCINPILLIEPASDSITCFWMDLSLVGGKLIPDKATSLEDPVSAMTRAPCRPATPALKSETFIVGVNLAFDPGDASAGTVADLDWGGKLAGFDKSLGVASGVGMAPGFPQGLEGQESHEAPRQLMSRRLMKHTIRAIGA